MRRGLALGLMALESVLLAGCAAGRQAASRPVAAVSALPLAISGVAVEPKTITAGEGAPAIVRCRVNQDASVTMEIVDAEGVAVRQLQAASTQGGYSAGWDGRDAQRRLVPGGVYRYVLHARGADGREAVHDPSTENGGEEIEPRDFTYDAATRTWRWVMPRAGWARLRIGIEGFPHLRTLLDWRPLEAGPHELAWDGRDASGLLQIDRHPHLTMKLMAFAMPHNTIIVRNETSSAARPSQAAAYAPLVQKRGGAFHAKHPRAVCREVRFRVEFPDAAPRDAQGRPVLSGTVPVRVMLDERDASYIVNQRYEVAFFEDLVTLFEEEESSNPLTYLWDTSHLTPGEHALTVNILSYDDHFGVVTVPVVIGEHS